MIFFSAIFVNFSRIFLEIEMLLMFESKIYIYRNSFPKYTFSFDQSDHKFEQYLELLRIGISKVEGFYLKAVRNVMLSIIEFYVRESLIDYS